VKTFLTKVNKGVRVDMIEFLRTHFRYDTMSSWNRVTSYANCIKIHALGLESSEEDRAFEMLDVPDAFNGIHLLLRRWAIDREWRYQVSFNGQSGGYLVLYQGGLDWKNAKTARCDVCSRTTYHTKTTPCTDGQCPGTLCVLEKALPAVVTYAGRGMDEDEDFEQWSMQDLRERVRLIQSFDKVCDDAVRSFVDCCNQYSVVETQIMVPETVKVLRRNQAACE